VITTARLVLRPLRSSDARALAANADDPLIAENLRDGFPNPYSVRDARRFIASVRDAAPFSVLAIVRDGEPIGCVGLTPGNDVYRLNGEIGYWIGTAHWGQGLVTEAVGAFVRTVWEQTGMERLHAGVFSGNPASERVLEKCGFMLESVQRRAVIKNGRFRDLSVWFQLRER
jgi:RimJ/RimL family protein N-acetyltransferase